MVRGAIASGKCGMFATLRRAVWEFEKSVNIYLMFKVAPLIANRIRCDEGLGFGLGSL
jgi:hypothetical protein